MSTEENKALVRHWIEDVWMSNDADSVDQIFAPSYAVNDSPCPPAMVRSAMQMLHAAFSPFTASIQDLLAEGDRVAVRWVLRGHHSGAFRGVAATGQPVELRGTNIYRIAEGKIASNYEQVNAAEVVQQLRAIQP
ncbi:ester cyclase [Chloroflexia bacterium SDU3-3]|nr:ester cyclase [Chloroflexia bacterium SDU3-3]